LLPTVKYKLKYFFIINIYLLYILVFMCAPNLIFSQFSSSEFYGTKSNALGNVSTTFKDINAAYTNQAGLAFLSGTSINLSYENRFLTYDLSSIDLAIAKNFKKLGTFSFSVNKFGIEEYNEIQLGAAYAMKLNKKTALALQINFFNLSINGYGSRSTMSFETGILYDIHKDLSFGFHVTNPFPIKFIDDIELPNIISLGIKYLISENLNIFGEIEKHINYDLFFKSGIEYAPLTSFSLYFGFKNNFNNYADYSMGFKYKIKQFINVELSTLYNLTLGLSPSIGFTYNSIGDQINR